MNSELNSPTETDIRRTDRIMGGSMAFVALRCTLQYIILPFVLPLFGLSGGISTIISAIIDVFALGMIAYNIRRLWSTAWRWRYLGLSVVMVLVIGLFLYTDYRLLAGL